MSKIEIPLVGSRWHRVEISPFTDSMPEVVVEKVQFVPNLMGWYYQVTCVNAKCTSSVRHTTLDWFLSAYKQTEADIETSVSRCSMYYTDTDSDSESDSEIDLMNRKP